MPELPDMPLTTMAGAGHPPASAFYGPIKEMREVPV